MDRKAINSRNRIRWPIAEVDIRRTTELQSGVLDNNRIPGFAVDVRMLFGQMARQLRYCKAVDPTDEDFIGWVVDQPVHHDGGCGSALWLETKQMFESLDD